MLFWHWGSHIHIGQMANITITIELCDAHSGDNID